MGRLVAMWYSGVVGPSGKVCPIFLVLTIITAVDLMSSGVFKAVTTDNGVEWGIPGFYILLVGDG